MISGIDLKKILYNEPNLIEKLLESLGCEHIIVKENKITSTRPTGDNKGAVEIRLTETLNCRIYTKTDYSQKFKIQDILTLTQYFLDCEHLSDAVNYICNICNIKNDGDAYEKHEVNDTLSFLRKYKRIVKEDDEIEDIPLQESVLDQFIDAPCKIFTEDKIHILCQEKWGVCYDLLTNRACFPIRNYKGELITLKGRTLETNYKNLNIPKYFVYFNVETNHILFGEYENMEEINKSDSIILFESEKSVMKADIYGFNNCVAIGKKTISKQQRKRLLSYGKNIILAFDKDVELEELLTIARMFRGLVPVYFIYDKFDLLNEKCSPVDLGREVFVKLLENKLKYRDGANINEY
jgi:DNA primase